MTVDPRCLRLVVGASGNLLWSEVLADGPRLGIIATGHGGTRNVSRVVLGGVHRAIAYGLDITSSPQTYG